MELTEIKLEDGRIWKFKKDISQKKIRDLGEKPIQGVTPLNEIEAYNDRKICAFSHDPIVTMEMLDELPSFDHLKLIKDVLIAYNTKMQNFLSAPQKK